MTGKNMATSMLSDNDIKKYFKTGDINIYTEHKDGEFKFNIEKQLQLASIDLRFRNECKRFKDEINGNLTYEMLRNHEYTTPFEIANTEKLVIKPGEVIFTTTLETIVLSNEFAGIITGRSSIARLGIMVHCCQEFINPGQKAPIALQITNLGKFPVELDIRIPICQLIIFKLSSPASNEYSKLKNSKYKNETLPLSSQIHMEEETININESEPNNEDVHSFSIKAFLQKYFLPFIPSIIMFLLITPILGKLGDFTLAEVFACISKLNIQYYIICAMVILYIILKK